MAVGRIVSISSMRKFKALKNSRSIEDAAHLALSEVVILRGATYMNSKYMN